MTYKHKNVDKGHILAFKETIAKNALGDESEFFNWFNKTGDKDCTFIRGAWDFAIHIANPSAKYLDKPEEKNVLDLGYGGGRILAAAANAFKSVVGIDVHNQNELVEKELKDRGVKNFKLLQNDGRTISLEDGSIDFVY